MDSTRLQPRGDEVTLEGTRVTMLVMNDVRRDARVQKEAQALAQAGAHVVIAGVPKTDSRPWSTEDFDVRLVDRFSPNSNPIWPLRVVLNLAGEYALWRRLASAAQVGSPQVIHCHDLDTAWSGLNAARRTGAKLVYDAHELYTERTAIVWWRKWLLERIERRMLHEADLVFTANAERAEIMAEKYQTSRGMVPLLNVPSSLSWVDAPAPAAQAARQALGCEHLLMYQGTLAGARGLDAVVRAFEFLPAGYHLVLMGPGELGVGLRAATDIVALRGRVHLWPPVGVSDIPAWAAVADAGIVTYLPDSLNNKYCAPNKLYDYAAAGIPVVGADLPVIARTLTGQNAGVLFEPGDSRSFADAVMRMFTGEVSMDDYRRGARTLREQTSWETEAEKLIAAYIEAGV